MLAKSIIAGTVLSLMAGGVVYFGTDVDTATVEKSVANKTSEIKSDISEKVMAGGKAEHLETKKIETGEAETSVETPSVRTASGQVIEAKKPTVSYSSGSEDKTERSAEVGSPDKPQKKWLDQYLKKDKPETKAVTTTSTTIDEEEIIEVETSENKSDVAKDLMKTMGLTKEAGSDSDTGSFIVEEEVNSLTEEEIEAAEAQGFEERALETENIWVEDKSPESGEKKSTRKMLSEIIKKDSALFIGENSRGEEKVEVKVIADEDGETTIETETIDLGDGKIMKIVKKTVKSESHDDDGKKMHIKIRTKKDDSGKVGTKDISQTVKIVMEQAEKIELPELRDRAYLDLVSYGLEHEDYKVASKALKEIEQVELRDTARNRMAVAYAKANMAEDAFGILEDIEVEALKDVIRLQVIEAMIAPEELPEDMQ